MAERFHKPRHDHEAVAWRARRRQFLIGPAATWAALSACSPFREMSEESPRDDSAAVAQPPRMGGVIGRTPSAPIVRELAFDRPRNAANHMAWSADGRRLAIGSLGDVKMAILDVQSGRALTTPAEQFGGIRGLAYSPDGHYLAVSRGGIGLTSDSAGPLRYTVSLWDAQTAAPLQHLAEPDPRQISHMATYGLSFSFNGRLLAVAYYRDTAVYDLTVPGGFQRTVILPPAITCAFRPGVLSLACLRSLSGHDRIFIHGIPGGQVEREFDGPGKTLAWSPDGALLATATGPRIRVLDLTGHQPERILSSLYPETHFYSLSFSADGRWCAAVDHVRLELWETASWSHVATLQQNTKFILAASFSPAGSLLAAAGAPPVTIWNVH